MLEVLGDWHPAWPARPTGVAYVESARRPQLTRDLAEGLARYLKLPVVARWRSSIPTSARARARPTPPSGSPRSAALHLDVDEPLDGGPVLLVDDLVVTGWTLTLAARALRAAGATAVLPLTLGVSES